ncbi:acylphosphatase [Methylophaga sp. OBS3]|uniref:acylphosphatase n=1 Tax=Methylophaga sp. OBS3 TaxID=2991934 RepID=UPI0022571895|nr:acylphosphatase [Methylophaga sp. OBS3]MCX4190553.1 acylphosphatase [Methylophaga sp. OBS3]
MGISSKHLLVYGEVQGVGYRAATEQQAKALQLQGWVRNLPDGRVEILAQGEDTALQNLQNWTEQGPEHAAVSKVIAQPVAMNSNLTGFEIR